MSSGWSSSKFLEQGIPLKLDAFVLIIKTMWNAQLVDQLEMSCIKTLEQYGVEHKTIIVPGAIEISFTIQQYAKKYPNKINAFIALGVIIKGETPHFEMVCNNINYSITKYNTALNMPIIMGVLTVFTAEQAWDRTAQGKAGDKGMEAALTAMQMIILNRNISL